MNQFDENIANETYNLDSKYFRVKYQHLSLSIEKDANINLFRLSNRWISNFSDEFKVQVVEKKLNKFKLQSDPTNNTFSALRGLRYINKYVENEQFKNFDIFKNSFE